jgi:steroid delta-isomerase-like uncharacterized protein
MSLSTALDRYFAAWNDRDPAAVVESLVDGGTYEDPTTGGPLSGDALAASVATLLVGFPDLHFDIDSITPTGETTAAARWTMRGTNTGPMPGGPPTGGTIALPGADFLEYDPDADRVAKVVGYFDTATMLGQLGLQAHITPGDMEPITKFGTSLRVDAQRETLPGAFSITWIEIDPQYQPTLIESSTSIAVEQLGNDGYLGTCFATTGRRNYTFTAWESVDAARAALRGGAHAAAMRLVRTGGLGDNARGVTSLWKPDVLNGIFNAGGPSRDLSELTGQWL